MFSATSSKRIITQLIALTFMTSVLLTGAELAFAQRKPAKPPPTSKPHSPIKPPPPTTSSSASGATPSTTTTPNTTSSSTEPPPPPPAASGGPPTSEATAEKKQEAKERFERGMSHFDKKLWDAALAEFRESRAAYPTRSNTQNAALCLHNLNRFDEALDMFEALVREFPNLPDKQAVEQEIVELRSLVGTIAIKGVAGAAWEGALVTIDGRERGSTPIPPIRVSAGSHIVRVYKEGFSPMEKRIDLAGRQEVVVEVKLEALGQAGRLSVTEDAGKVAEVIVDNVVVGKTPWQGPVAVGDHVVFLRGDGELGTQPASALVRINQVTPIILALEPLECPVRVEPTPSGATVAIDGVVIGSGLWDGRLRKGRHKIEVAQMGFIPQERLLNLAPQKNERLSVQLERDPNSPLWRVNRPQRIFAEIAPSFPIGLVLGGDISNSGDPSFPIGAAGRVHVGYELQSGFGVALDAGYMYLTREVSGRDAVVRPVGKTEVRGTVGDRLTLRGLLAGGSAQLHKGETFPLLLRLGVGAFLANASDRRSGEFSTESGLITPASARTSTDALYLYVAPEVRIGYRVASRFELSVGTDVMLMVGLKEARWNSDKAIVLGNLGLAEYESQPLFGSTLVVLNPSLGARFDF